MVRYLAMFEAVNSIERRYTPYGRVNERTRL